MLLVTEELAVGHRLELAEIGRKSHGDHALDELLPPAPVLDEVGDGDHLQVVPLAERREVGHTGHRPVVVHDLADDARRVEACEPCEIDRRLGLTGAPQDAAPFRAEREDVTRLHEIVRDGARIDRDLDRPRAIVRRDSRRHALARLDRDRERRPERCLVVVGHRAELELVAALRGQAEADEARGRASP